MNVYNIFTYARALGKKLYNYVKKKSDHSTFIVKKSEQQLMSDFIALLNRAKKQNRITPTEWRNYVSTYKADPSQRNLLTDKITRLIENSQSNT